MARFHFELPVSILISWNSQAARVIGNTSNGSIIAEYDVLLQGFSAVLKSSFSSCVVMTSRPSERQALAVMTVGLQSSDLERVGALLVNPSEVDVLQALHLQGLLVEHAVGLIDVHWR